MSVEALDAHLATGVTGVARCWRLTRRDGVVHGFTDHDRDLGFDGTIFLAGTGLSAAALSQSTGLAVDNSEAVGALSDVSVTEADIVAGRFDGAEVEAWLVEWANPENRVMQFRGSIGEISRSGGGVHGRASRPCRSAQCPHGAGLSAQLPRRPRGRGLWCGSDIAGLRLRRRRFVGRRGGACSFSRASRPTRRGGSSAADCACSMERLRGLRARSRATGRSTTDRAGSSCGTG